MFESLESIFITPFTTYLFLKRALLATIGIALGSGPVGVLLVLRRMSLMGDALSHAILPGIAISYLFVGFTLPLLGIGGIIAGIIVATLGGLIARKTILHEDASFTGFYSIALALGILILAVKGGNMRLMHLLFGNVLGVDEGSLLFIALTTTFSLIVLALIYRPLVYECFDPVFVRMMGINGRLYEQVYMIIVVINLVAACQALGTMMALGIMMLPAITARLWAHQVWSLFLLSTLLALISGYLGLVLSNFYDLPSGPTIILVAGVFYILSLLKTSVSNRVYIHP